MSFLSVKGKKKGLRYLRWRVSSKKKNAYLIYS